MPTFSKLPTQKLLRQVAAGKEIAFRTLFEQYHPKIYSFALYLTHSEIMAEEVTQEIFIKIWTHRSQLTDVQYFNSWIKTLVRNHTYSLLRHMAVEKRALEELQAQMNTVPETEKENPYKEREELLTKAIDNLPPRQKEVYLLSRRQGMKHALIAEKLGLSIHTIKNHIKAALHSIRTFIETNKESIL